MLEALPAHERTATVLFYLGGYSQLEIAAFLGVTVMTVKKRLQASRKRMQGKVVEMMSETLREQAPSKDDRLVDAVRFLAELEAAAVEGDMHLVELLLVDGVDVDAQDASGRTLLSCAAQRGSLDGVELLLRHGADVNAKDRTGKTPLRWASDAKQTATAALLRKGGGTL